MQDKCQKQLFLKMPLKANITISKISDCRLCWKIVPLRKREVFWQKPYFNIPKNQYFDDIAEKKYL